jgi:hypothetical protein
MGNVFDGNVSDGYRFAQPILLIKQHSIYPRNFVIP